MLTKTMVTFGAAVSLCAAISLAPLAGAQTTGTQTRGPPKGLRRAPSGTTSGPASGSPTTMGTTGIHARHAASERGDPRPELGGQEPQGAKATPRVRQRRHGSARQPGHAIRPVAPKQ